MRVQFDEVSVKGVRRWADADGKKRQETKRFWQTLSPFNKMPDGRIKNRSDVLTEINAERAAWLAEVRP